MLRGEDPRGTTRHPLVDLESVSLVAIGLTVASDHRLASISSAASRLSSWAAADRAERLHLAPVPERSQPLFGEASSKRSNTTGMR